MDNIIAALEHNDRVLKIDLRRLEPSPELENVVRAIPSVDISESPWTVKFFPDSLLAGSAPRLEHLHLDGIPFLGSSGTDLVYLELPAYSLLWIHFARCIGQLPLRVDLPQNR